MFLASLLSVFAGAWMFAAAPFTVTMKSAGYSARSDGKTVTVTQVAPKSVAAEAGLKKGMKVTSIFLPYRAFTQVVPLAQLGATDLQDALTPQPAEVLGLLVETAKGAEQAILKSREPVPDNPFPVIPLTLAQQQRLTPMQLSHYQVRLMQAAREQQEGPPLKFEQETTAYVMKGKLAGVEGGGATPLKLHPSIALKTDCRSGMEKLELSSTAKDLNLTLRPEDARHPGAPFELAPALWTVPQVLEQCDGATKPLEHSLHVRLTCKGKPPVEQDATVKLAVRCDVPAPVTRWLMFLGQPWEFMEGDKTPLEVDVATQTLIPRPAEVAIVELDADGKVTRHLSPVPIAKSTHDSSTKVQVALDTTAARTVRLAVEVRYADGSTRLTEPQTREIVSQAQLEARRREVIEARAKLDAFEKRFDAKFNDPCDDLPATMKWLKDQPDLEFASAAENGHSFSYKVKGALAPLVFTCDR
ncbi:hypothetical protein [Corallococcus sp. EGB]|uniref:hypothetical protein n=1 Tax=Corallococcus sp. EGB TaxID=1521117 RepID=UPI001CBB620C|nr:hypothetical protein [Corallococcus sp. EGB]